MQLFGGSWVNRIEKQISPVLRLLIMR